MSHKVIAFFLTSIIGILSAFSQNATYRAYIERYAPLAVEQMKLHGIPASITLAQGLLESAAGTSVLATKANNHFGIKTGGSWNGPYIVKSDDRPDDRFRKYRSVRDSYEDHSLFLAKRARYAPLFKLRTSDYKGWAHGLRKCGYATNPRYGHLLIDLIERYDLHRYDAAASRHARTDRSQRRRRHGEGAESRAESLRVGRQNGTYYVTSRPGDTYQAISKEMNISVRKLKKYNELPGHISKRDLVPPGTRLYLQKKRTRLQPGEGPGQHVLQPGQSLHDVAQRYGLRLKTVVKLNRDISLRAGEKVRLR